MKTLDEVRSELADRNLAEVAKRAGIHPNALYRFMAGGNEPKYSTVQKLVAYLEQQK